jgi:hypothetical protein
MSSLVTCFTYSALAPDLPGNLNLRVLRRITPWIPSDHTLIVGIKWAGDCYSRTLHSFCCDYTTWRFCERSIISGITEVLKPPPPAWEGGVVADHRYKLAIAVGFVVPESIATQLQRGDKKLFRDDTLLLALRQIARKL